jgi:chromosome segregation ATPase
MQCFFLSFQVSQSKLQDSQSAIESYKKENRELKEAKSALQKGIRELTCENDSLRTSLNALKTKVKVLEVQLRQEREVVEPQPHQPPGATSESKQLKEHISQLETFIVELKEENVEKEHAISALEFSLQDSSQALKNLYKERDLLKNRIAGLLNEIEVIRYQAPEPKQTFSEYIQLKRDFTSLRDEHEKLLKKRSSKPNILPCLTADAKTVARTYGGSSLRSKTSNNS